MNPGTIPAGLSGNVPDVLTGLLTFSQYNYLMGLSGIAAALVVMLIWSRGL